MCAAVNSPGVRMSSVTIVLSATSCCACPALMLHGEVGGVGDGVFSRTGSACTQKNCQHNGRLLHQRFCCIHNFVKGNAEWEKGNALNFLRVRLEAAVKALVEKRQRAAAVQDASRVRESPANASRFGLRQPSAAIDYVLRYADRHFQSRRVFK